MYIPFMKEIKLTQGKVALVDDEDFEWLNGFKWCADKNNYSFYAVRVSMGKKIYMHREILNISLLKTLADHKDRNGLNNQRDNLRIATRSQNNTNKTPMGISKYLGVVWHGQVSKWMARVSKDSKVYHLGLFTNEEDAAIAYNKKAFELYGEFANQNIVNKDYI